MYLLGSTEELHTDLRREMRKTYSSIEFQHPEGRNDKLLMTPRHWPAQVGPRTDTPLFIDTRTTTFETFSVTFFSLNVVSLAPLSPTRLPPTTHTKLWNSSPPGHHAPPLSTLTPCPLSPHTPCAPHHSSPHIPLRLRATHTCTRTHPRTLSPTLYV